MKKQSSKEVIHRQKLSQQIESTKNNSNKDESYSKIKQQNTFQELKSQKNIQNSDYQYPSNNDVKRKLSIQKRNIVNDPYMLSFNSNLLSSINNSQKIDNRQFLNQGDSPDQSQNGSTIYFIKNRKNMKLDDNSEIQTEFSANNDIQKLANNIQQGYSYFQDQHAKNNQLQTFQKNQGQVLNKKKQKSKIEEEEEESNVDDDYNKNSKNESEKNIGSGKIEDFQVSNKIADFQIQEKISSENKLIKNKNELKNPQDYQLFKKRYSSSQVLAGQLAHNIKKEKSFEQTQPNPQQNQEDNMKYNKKPDKDTNKNNQILNMNSNDNNNKKISDNNNNFRQQIYEKQDILDSKKGSLQFIKIQGVNEDQEDDNNNDDIDVLEESEQRLNNNGIEKKKDARFVTLKDPKEINEKAIENARNFLDVYQNQLTIKGTIRSALEEAIQQKETELQRIPTLEQFQIFENDKNNKLISKLQKVTFFINGKALKYAEKSLFCLSGSSKIRTQIARLLESNAFIWLVRVFSILNTVAYILYDYSFRLGKEYDNVNINNVSWNIELVCNIFFAMEMVMDITVQGFIFGQGTYLKDMWGWVNGSSVVISLVLYIPGIKGTSAYTYLQVIKMLRPMRLIYVFPVLKRSLESLVRTLPEVGKQFLNLFIIMVFYGILGLHMFMGALEYRCRLTEEPPTDGSDWQVDENQPYLCGNYECSENTYCKAPFNFDESFNNNERYIGNFNFGYTNFDNILWSLLTVFHIVRETGWSSITFLYWRYLNKILVAVYFVSMMLICSYILVNILLGILYTGFIKHSQIDDYDEYKEAQKLEQEEQKQNKIVLDLNFQRRYRKELNDKVKKVKEYRKQQARLKIMKRNYSYIKKKLNSKNVSSQNSDYLNQQKAIVQAQQDFQNQKREEGSNDNIIIGFKNTLSKHFNFKTDEIDEYSKNNSQVIKKNFYPSDINMNSIGASLSTNKRFFRDNATNLDISKCRKAAKNVLETQGFYYFSSFITIGILIVLSLDRHPIEDSEKRVLNIIEGILIILYTFETLIRISDYHRDFIRQNLLTVMDIILVLANIIEFIVRAAVVDDIWIDETDVGSLIRILKSLRIFRFLYDTKLLFPLNQMIYAFLKTFKQISYYMLMCMVFCITFGSIAQELFAFKARFLSDGSITENLAEGSSPDTNFDTFWNAVSAMFQFILNEEWHVSMYYFSMGTSDVATLFWVFIIISGEVMVMKLFLALFINNYLQKTSDIIIDSQEEKKQKGEIDVRTQITTKPDIINLETIENFIFRDDDDVEQQLPENIEEHPRPEILVNNNKIDIQKTQTIKFEEDIKMQEYKKKLLKNSDKEELNSHFQYEKLRQEQNNNQQQLQYQNGNEGVNQNEINIEMKISDKLLKQKQNENQNYNEGEQIQEQQDDDFNSTKKLEIAKDESLKPPLKVTFQNITRFQTVKKTFNEEELIKKYRVTKIGENKILDPKQQRIMDKYQIQRIRKKIKVFLYLFFNKMEIQATLPFLNQSVYGEQIDTYLQEMIKLYCLMTYKIEQQGWWSKLRLKVLQFIRSTKFEVIIASIIILNCIMNALDNPLSNPDKAYKQLLKNLDYIVTFIYTVEAIIKIIAYRFIVGRFAYIRDAWNCIDFCVLLISLSSYGTDNGLGIFKALRALRLLKISQYLSGLKLVMISLGKSAKMLFHLCIFAFAVSLVVGLIPVKFLKGSYYYCTNLDDGVNSDFIVTKQDCLDFGGDWINQDFNWDNIVSGLFNLFIIATCEGWTAFQYLAWQAKGVDLEPVKGNNKNWTIFFIAYFIVGNLMVFNTFIGVLIEKFNYIKKLVFRTKININTYYPGKEISEEGLEQQEKNWLKIKEQIYKAKPKKAIKKPKGKFQSKIFQIFHQNQYYSKFNDICILLNTLVFMLHYHRQPVEYEHFLNYVNYLFVFIFLIEIMIQVIMYGKQFFQQKWNCFEFFLLITALVGSFWREAGSESLEKQGEIKIMLRLFQVFRACRLVKSFRFLQQMFSTLTFVLPQVGPVAGIFLLCLLIFTLFGQQIFPYIKSQQYVNGYDLHFRDFGSALFSLIRVASGEQWFQLVGDIVRQQQPNFTCEEINNYEDYQKYGFNGCGTNIGYAFFFIFHLMVSVIFLNLFMALVLSNVIEAMELEDQAVNTFQLNDIKQLWVEFDPEGEGFINYKDFWRFTSNIAMIYNVNKDDLLNVENKKNFLKVLNIPIYENKNINLFGYQFHDVIVKLTRMSLYLKTGEALSLKEDEDSFNNNPNFQKTEYNSGDMANIILMQRKIKKWIFRNREKISKQNQYQMNNGAPISSSKMMLSPMPSQNKQILEIQQLQQSQKESSTGLIISQKNLNIQNDQNQQQQQKQCIELQNINNNNSKLQNNILTDNNIEFYSNNNKYLGEKNFQTEYQSEYFQKQNIYDNAVDPFSKEIFNQMEKNNHINYSESDINEFSNSNQYVKNLTQRQQIQRNTENNQNKQKLLNNLCNDRYTNFTNINQKQFNDGNTGRNMGNYRYSNRSNSQKQKQKIFEEMQQIQPKPIYSPRLSSNIQDFHQQGMQSKMKKINDQVQNPDNTYMNK